MTPSLDRTAQVWNAATGQVIAKLEGHFGPLDHAVVSPGGERVLTASRGGTALVFRIVTLDEIARLLASK